MFEVIQLGNLKTVATKSACNHVYVVDVSGSMYHDLPKIRQNLKNIINVVAQPEDTFSVIYFSGKGQCGVVFENLLVSDVSTIDSMHKAIDRFIQPIGLTGFIDPIKKALELDLDSSKVNNFIMLTDGFDNQSRRDDILTQAKTLTSKYQSISFIEYGYYADRDLLTQMANEVGGTHIFADGYNKYEGVIEDVVRSVTRVANVEVNVNKKAKHAAYIYGDQIRIVDAKDGVVSVPEDVDQVFSIVPSDVISKQISEERLFLILYYAAKTSNSDLVWKVLQALGDVNLVEKYQNAFTKQEQSIFEEEVRLAVFDESKRFVLGKDTSVVPTKNAPTVIDLLNGLADTDSFVITDSPYWSYNRTTRGTVKEEGKLPRFVPSPMSRLSLKGLVFNSERPNVNIQTSIKGQVELPENDFGLKKVPSFITRNYTVIKDGIRNMDHLPVVFPESAAAELEKFAHEVVEQEDGQCYWVFDLTRIPVINRAMVENIKLEDFVRAVETVEPLKARLKVLTHMIKEDGGSTAKIEGMVQKYGEEAAKWLSENGVRDYGFSPVGTKSADVTDEYESIQVVYKIKGLSSLPAISAVEKKVLEGKKLNLADSLIQEYMDVYGEEDKSVLEHDKEVYTRGKRENEKKLANLVYTLVLGRKWFSDDEVTEVDVVLNGQKAPMTIEKVRKMIKI